MLRNMLILLLGIAIGAAAYAFISRFDSGVDLGPNYETAITVLQGQNLVRETVGKPEYTMLKTENGDQLKSLVISKAALLNMMSHANEQFAGIRLYPVFKSNKQSPGNNFSLVIVPFKKEGDAQFSDILHDNFMYDYLNPCPSMCPKPGTSLLD